ncbi:MAG: autotransporter-associated beta strand repeat-containing protein, partial [Planctomycetota bacterium]|nr:autotransporter-associated beta strand repeat-containing protein [Planctomycetota bacterium]
MFLVAAVAAIVGLLASAAGADTWTGAAQIGSPRSWAVPGNWLNGVVVPPPNDAATIGIVGDGVITLNPAQSAGGFFFQSFVNTTIGQPGELLTLVNPPWTGKPFVKTNEQVRDTYGCDYFTAGPRLAADLFLGDDFEIYMGTANNSSLMISGKIVGGFDKRITLFDDPAGAGTSRYNSLWFTADNAQYYGDVTVNTRPNGGGTSIKLADAGRLGTATITLNGNLAGLGLLGTAPGTPTWQNLYLNDILSRSGGASCPVVYADRSYQQNVFASQRDVLQYNLTQWIHWVTLDNPTGDSAIAFGSQSGQLRTHNGYTIYSDGLILGTSNPDVNTKTVYVNLGNYTEGLAGHRYMGGVNNLNRSINEAWFSGDPHPSLEDFGQTLIKAGLGILEFGYDNTQEIDYPDGSRGPASSGAKRIDEGVLRFNLPQSIGRTLAGTQPPIILNQVGGRVSAGVGIGWDGALPTFTVPGTVIGQSGALDIDTDGEDHNKDGTPEHAPQYTQFLDFFGNANIQNLRLGSSSRVGGVIWSPGLPSIISPNPDNVYHLGGGGGTLGITTPLTDWVPDESSSVEMATTGLLLPGRVILCYANPYTGKTVIYAGTLQLARDRPDSIAQSSELSVDTTCTRFDGTFTGPTKSPFAFQGPGQLLLDPTVAYNLPQPRPPAPAVLGGSPMLDGGAVGWTSNITLSSLSQIGTYGYTITSTLANPNPAGVATNLLHLGGEYSGTVGNRVTMTAATGWVITDNGTTPVALVKTGIYNDLDLTGGGPNTYTGGTAILGGEVIVSSADQLSIGPILIANGGRLKVTQTTTFANTLKGVTGGTPGVVWWNGSVIEVDEDQTAAFYGLIDNTLSPSTPFEKVGQGTLFFEYRVGGAPTAYPRGSSNQWGLKLTEGLVSVNQLPLGPATGNPDNGFLVCLGGDLIVRPAPLGTSTADPNYGFSGIASFQGTTSTLTVQDGALLRANGRWEHTFMGTVILAAQDSDGDPRNNIFHFSHNGTSEGPPIRDSRGTGTVDLRGGMVAMTTNGNFLAVMPQEADFTLRLNGGIYNGMPEATLNGNLTINALLPTGGPRIDGEVYSADRSVVAPTSWTIAGTGATAWRGTLEKVGPGIVTFSRSPGAPVTVAPPSTLRISGGTVNAGGAADPFTDTAVAGALLDIDNNATFNITAGSKQLNGLSGGGGTTNVAGGAALTVQNAVQNVLSLGAGASVTLRSAFGASQVSTLDAANASPGTATVSVAGGQTLTVAGAGGWFSIGPGSTLLKTGPGTLDINQRQSNGAGSTLTVAAGTVILSTNAGATGLPPAYAPGLVVGRLSGAFDTTSPNPATAVQAGVAQMNYAGYWDGIVWVDNATWVYSGQFYEDDGQVSFAENFDDNVLLRVDVNGNGVFDPGETWLNDVTWNSPTTSGPQALAAGQWYDFEARFGQGLGGIGPVSGWFVGLGWDTLGRGTLNPADYVTPPDSMFRRSLGGTPGTSVLLGDTSGAADASLLISGPYTVSWGITVQSGSAGNITLGGTNTSGTATFAGNVSLARSAALTAAAGGTVAFTGTVSGAGGVTKTGGGTVALSGSNIQYTGPTTVSGGLLRLSDATAFASAITDNAAVEFQATTGTWTFSQPLGGTGTVDKSGDGTLVLTAANSYNGGTTVSAG